MNNKKRFNFIEKTDTSGQTSLVPYLPLILSNETYSVNTLGLLDTGASVNVLPYQLGLELGLNWKQLNIKEVGILQKTILFSILRSWEELVGWAIIKVIR